MTDSSALTKAHVSFCAAAKPILWSARDSDETIRQVKEHNAAGSALCGWGAAGHGAPVPPSQ
jgi:hypothetical protein